MEADEREGLKLTGVASVGTGAAVGQHGGGSQTPVFASCWCGNQKVAQPVRRTPLPPCFKGAWLNACECCASECE